jgi:hypothetical protein
VFAAVDAGVAPLLHDALDDAERMVGGAERHMCAGVRGIAVPDRSLQVADSGLFLVHVASKTRMLL